MFEYFCFNTHNFLVNFSYTKLGKNSKLEILWNNLPVFQLTHKQIIMN